ncbi:MAG: hypothetical protein E6J09_09920 [Chloroflexi bacterium]|nr:MAG: hypothetical protein E6J09_09920 [Chloroflexota bacterium]
MWSVNDERFSLPPGIAAFGLIALVAASCVPSTRQGATTPATPQQRVAGLQSVLVSSQLVVGRERLAIGVLDANTPINDAQVRVRVYRGSPNDPLANEADAPFKGDGLQGRGIYVAYVSFGTAGPWVAEIAARKAGGTESVNRVPVTVATTGSVPGPGQPAPRSRNLTRADVPDLTSIDSGVPPDDMHDLSIADAIAQQRPALIVFATPAFCTSAMCGPEVRAVQQLEPDYRARVAFIHVEIYRDFKPDPSKMSVTPTVLEWHLQTDPWVFLVDPAGTVRYAFEGPTATDELRTALDAMLAKGGA